MLYGKGNSTHRPSKAKITDNHITEHSLTSPFTMEELMKGIKILKNNKAAGLDDMLCEQIKHLGPKATVLLKEMMNNVLVSKKFPKLWRKSKVIVILKPGKDSSLPKSYRPISLLCHTYKLLERMILNRMNPITEHTIIKEQAGFRAAKSCTSQLLKLTQYIEDGYAKSLIYIPPRDTTSTHYKTADTDIQHCIQYITNIPHSVLTGDVNAHSTLWHSYTDDHRGQLIANVISNSDHITLNTNTPTRVPNTTLQQTSSPRCLTHFTTGHRGQLNTHYHQTTYP